MKIYESTVGMSKQSIGCHNNLKTTKSNSQIEDSQEYSTIDGEVINSSLGSDAVKKGTGLFIGDYFVGILDSLSGVNNMPYLRY
ncbi:MULTISPECIES: hypothetical protein [Pontibacter]|uniref:Uncharacterized protein n=1 Tax=Pontibacter lucknowensis TaxID=1077936 RepID=A0A1N6WDU3_9BACT|nr:MULTISPECIES: hypothetical protein [Pontibacter]EJF08826.1 hypothetical protein O71_18466 [Pontibacter sp. BAB1700]SIQ88125.1 hypothetical protein SAMN05421545_1477 [Pontibacter lucknowensis]